MRTTVIILFVFIFALLAVIFLGVTEMNDRNRTQQKEIDHWKKVNILKERAYLKALDSIRTLQLVQADSTKFYKSQKEKDQTNVKTKTEKHETIVFVNLNDSTRHSKLAKFYASYKHP